MEAYNRRKGEYQTVDLDALFSSVCAATIIVVLSYTNDVCEEPLREWLFIKCLSLMFRVAVKSTFPSYNQEVWFKFVMALIKLFSFVWVVMGIIWIIREDTCSIYTSWLYSWVSGFILVFVLGSLGFFGALIIACIALKKSSEQNDDLQARLYLV